jgi:Domain of unknown function (DUF4398)
MILQDSMLIGLVVLGLSSMGCGRSAVPVDKLSDSKSTILAAEEVGAQQDPKAALHLKLAHEELDSAQRAIDKGDNDQAILYLNQAKADADLALAIARDRGQTNAARAAQGRVETLRSQAQ